MEYIYYIIGGIVVITMLFLAFRNRPSKYLRVHTYKNQEDHNHYEDFPRPIKINKDELGEQVSVTPFYQDKKN